MSEENLVRQFLDWRRRTVDESNQRMQQGNVAQKVLNNASRQAASGVSGFVRPYIDAIPDTYGLYNFGSAGVEHFITDRDRQNDEGEPMSYLERVERSRYGEEGYQKLLQFENAAQEQWQQQNPNATEEDLNNWYQQFIRSRDYLNAEREILGGWVGVPEQLADDVDDAVGAPRDIDKRPIEFGMHSLGMAFNPAAALVTRAIPEVKGHRTAKLIAELTLPGSQLNNPKISAIEGSIGGMLSTGLAATIDAAVGAPDAQVTPDQVPLQVPPKDDEPDDTAEELAGIFPSFLQHPEIAGIFAALGASTRKVKGVRADPPKFAEGGAGGPATPPEEAIRTNRVATALGENAPIRKSLEDGGASVSEAAEVTSEVALNARASYGPAREAAYFRGELPDGTKVTPVQQFLDGYKQLRQEGLAGQYAVFRRAETQLDTRDGLVLDHNNKISDVLRKQQDNYQAIELTNKRLTEAQTSRERNAARDRLDKLQAENNALSAEYVKVANDPNYKKLLSDDPESRQGLTGMSSDELRALIAEGRKNPVFNRLKEVEKDIYKGILKLRSPWLGPDEIDNIMKKHPNYMPQRWAVHSGIDGMKGPVERFKGVWRDRLRMDEDFYGNMLGDNPSMNQLKKRDADNAPDAKVNMPNDPLEAMTIELDNAIRAYQANEFRASTVDSLRKQYRSTGQRPPYKLLAINSNTAISKAQANTLIQKGKLDPKKYINVWKDGKVSFYKFDDPDLHGRLKDLPHTTVPILRTFSRIWKAGTTGILNPAFAPVSAAYDQVVANVTRNRGTTLGFDYAVDQTLRAMGIRQDSTVREVARNTARIMATPIDPVGFALQLEAALRSTYLQTKEHWSNKVLRDLVNEHGAIGMMAKNPAAAAALKKAAESSLQSFQKSLFYQLTSSRNMQSESIAPAIQRIHDYEKSLDIVMPKTVDALASPFAESFNLLRFFVTGLKQSTQFSYASRQHAMLLERTGGKMDTAQYRKGLDKIMKDTRVLTGDFNEKPGSGFVQGFDSTAPFTNVMFVSTRHLYHSMRADPAMFATTIGSLGLAKAYSEYIMSNWDKEAYDDYWRNTPLWKRTMTIRLPTAETALAWAMGQKVPFTDDAYVELAIANELRALVEGMAQPIRAMGFYGAAQNEQLAENHGIGDTMSMALSQAFIPIVPTAAAIAGASPVLWDGKPIKVDPGAPMTGGELFDINSGKYAEHPINQESDITQGYMELTGAVLGTFGKNLLNAYDTGEQVSRDNGMFAGILAGGKEVLERSFVPSKDTPVAALLGSHVTKWRYRSTPISKQVGDMREAFTLARGGPGMKAVKETGEPIMDMMLNNLKNIANRDPRMKAFSTQYTDISERIKTSETNKQLSYTERLNVRNSLYEELATLNKQQSIYMRELESKLGSIQLPQGATYNDLFKEKYGSDFSFETFAEQAREFVGRQ